MRGAPAATPGPGAPFGALRARVRGEEGFGLIEVLVSALLVALIAVGVLAGLDSASATSGVERQRAVAAGLAQQDQEQLRSLKATDLANLSSTPVDQTVSGTNYHVAHTATWVDDSSTGGSCSASSVAGFMKVTSTVTWDAMHVAPTTISSLISPPLAALGSSDGSLTVNVTDAAGNGVSGVAVSLSGPSSPSATTDSSGCAKWSLLPAGSYTVTISKPGYIDPQGNATPTASTSVVGSTTNAVAFSYDQAGSATVQFDTKVAGQTTVLGPPTNPQFTDLVTASHGTTTVLGTFNTWINTVTFNNLFPYTSAYTFYAGDCAGAIPNQTPNTGTPASAIVPPGGSVNVTARVPDMNISVKNNTTLVNNANVKITQTGSGCTHIWRFKTGAYNLPGLTPVNGQIPHEAFPYGTYTVCADDGTGVNVRTTTGSNTSPNGINITLDMNKAPNGLCN